MKSILLMFLGATFNLGQIDPPPSKGGQAFIEGSAKLLEARSSQASTKGGIQCF